MSPSYFNIPSIVEHDEHDVWRLGDFMVPLIEHNKTKSFSPINTV